MGVDVIPVSQVSELWLRKAGYDCQGHAEQGFRHRFFVCQNPGTLLSASLKLQKGWCSITSITHSLQAESRASSLFWRSLRAVLHRSEGSLLSLGLSNHRHQKGAEPGPAYKHSSALWPAEGARGPCQKSGDCSSKVLKDPSSGAPSEVPVTLSFGGPGLLLTFQTIPNIPRIDSAPGTSDRVPWGVGTGGRSAWASLTIQGSPVCLILPLPIFPSAFLQRTHPHLTTSTEGDGLGVRKGCLCDPG